MSKSVINPHEIFSLFLPQGKIRGIISIPHSGEWIPGPFASYLTDDLESLAEDVDTKVDQLIDIKKLNEAGIAIIVAKVHRVAMDLNRKESEALLNWPFNTKGIKLVIKQPTDEMVRDLIKIYYTHYFIELDNLIQKSKDEFGIANIIDLHSMPSKPTDFHLKKNPNQDRNRPDFCLSDFNGKTCAPTYISKIYEYLVGSGFSPKVNDPYLGGHITQRLAGDSTSNIVQIEIKRSLYLDEKGKVLLKDKSAQLNTVLSQLMLNIFG